MEALNVEVASVTPEQQTVRRLVLPAGSTVADALAASGYASPQPGLAVGIFGRRCGLGQALTAGDRVEIYRPLRTDPKDSRRQRARRKPLRG